MSHIESSEAMMETVSEILFLIHTDVAVAIFLIIITTIKL